MSVSPNFVGGFNTGVQRSYTFFDNTTGLPVDMGGDVIDLQASPINDHITIKPISNKGYDKFKTQRSGWKGTVTVARNNDNMDLFESVQEALFHNGSTQKYFTIIDTTQNDDGTADVYQFTGVELFMDDDGMAKKDAAIEIKLGFNAQGRQPVV